MRVLVAGAGGFIGSELVRVLLARGHSVVALGRTAAKLESLPPEARRVVADVRDRAAVANAAKDCDAVAHLALPDITSKYREAYPIWIEGTRALLAASVERGMKAFALASGCIGTYRHAPGEWVDETSPLEMRSRLIRGRGEAVALAHAAHRASGLAVQVLRPPFVYGLGGGFGTFFLDYMRRGRYRVLGDGSNFTAFVHVADCALAFALALEKAPSGEEFIVADDAPVTLREASDLIAGALHVKRPGTVPKFLAALVIGRDAVALATDSVRVRNGKAKAVLGWRLRYPTLRGGLPSVVP